VTAAGWTERYAYDEAGNLTDASWPAIDDGADLRGGREYSGTLLRRAGGFRYEHDKQGRVVLRQQKQTSTKPRTWRYAWDAEDRLIAVTTPDGERWRYRYDPLGRRIAKQRLGTGDDVVEQIEFIWDDHLLAEQVHTAGAESVRSTVWEYMPGSFTPLTQTEGGVAAGGVIGGGATGDADQEEIDRRFYAIVADLTGTPTELVDGDGNVAWYVRTSLWGIPVETRADGVGCPLRFPGQYHDPETGANYNFQRYYEPATARYQSSDPIGLAAAPNPHAYVVNPYAFADPLGLAPCAPGGLNRGGATFQQAGAAGQ
jgi:RHS repeat-associated protein